MKKLPWFFLLLGAVFYAAWAAQLESKQIVAVGIFSCFILGTLFYWQFRLAFALVGITCLLASQVIDIPMLIEFANVDIILFLVAMMIVIGFLEERKFFEVLLERLLRSVERAPYLLFISMMILAMLSAALVDEVTSILFMTALTLHLTRRFKLDPFPYVLMIVFATNVGSSATVVGNPIGVLIALRAGLSFSDFLRWASPIAVAGLVMTVGICFLVFRKPLRELADKVHQSRGETIEVEQFNQKEFRRAGLNFGLTILGLVFHHQMEHLLHLPKNTMLIGVPFLMAGIALFIEQDRARELVEKRVDWWTLCFFLLLFASVGTLHYVGVTDRIAGTLQSVAGTNPALMLAVIIGLTALLTAFLDNILVVAMFVPIVGTLTIPDLPQNALWWALLFGGTFGGNATMIGSTANIVAIGMLEKQKVKISFARWLAPGLAVTIPTLILAFFLLLFQLPLMK